MLVSFLFGLSSCGATLLFVFFHVFFLLIQFDCGLFFVSFVLLLCGLDLNAMHVPHANRSTETLRAILPSPLEGADAATAQGGSPGAGQGHRQKEPNCRRAGKTFVTRINDRNASLFSVNVELSSVSQEGESFSCMRAYRSRFVVEVLGASCASRA